MVYMWKKNEFDITNFILQLEYCRVMPARRWPGNNDTTRQLSNKSHSRPNNHDQ